MTGDPLKVRFGGPGDARFDRCSQIMTAMLTAAALDRLQDDMDPAEHTMLTMTAAQLLGGYLAGASIIAGTLLDRDMRRVRQAGEVTFRQGIKLGKHNAMDAAGRAFGSGNA